MFSHVSHVSQFSFEDLFYLLVWITREYIGSCNNGSDWIMPGPSRWQIATIIPLFTVGFLKSASCASEDLIDSYVHGCRQTELGRSMVVGP
jgi:hypothetical protein